MVLHEEYLRLGLNRRAIQDSLRLQAGIDYHAARASRSRRRPAQEPRRDPPRLEPAASPNREIPVSGELVFFGYALRYGEDRHAVGGFEVAKLPARRPPPREPGTVAYVGCGSGVDVPLSEIDRVVAAGGAPGVGPGNASALVAAAEFAVVDARCQVEGHPAGHGAVRRSAPLGRLHPVGAAVSVGCGRGASRETDDEIAERKRDPEREEGPGLDGKIGIELGEYLGHDVDVLALVELGVGRVEVAVPEALGRHLAGEAVGRTPLGRNDHQHPTGLSC